MNRTLFLISLVFIFFTNSIFAQLPVGYKFDINGHPFDGFYDPFAYYPEEKISFVHNSDSFERGYYYDNTNNKKAGLIKFENKKIWFKRNNDDFKVKIKPEEINSIVLGVDSFFTISHFFYKERFKEKPELVQYVTQIGDVTFAKHYHFPNTGYTSTITETFLTKSKEDKIWESLSGNDTQFKEIALKYFGHINYFEKRIKDGDYTEKDALTLIKSAEYFSKFEKGENIFYDQYWQEIRNQENAKYHAQILNVNDSVWTLAYFEKTSKLYEIDYSAFYPNTINGFLKSFYKGSQLRQKIEFKDNKLLKVSSYLENGFLLHEYVYRKIYTAYDDPKPQIRYTLVNDSLGQNLIDSLTTFNTIFYDRISNYKYFHTYENKRLIESYRIMDEKKIHQITESEYDYNINNIQRKFNTYTIGLNYDRALSENAQGIILVSFIVDEKGFVIEYNIINRIHPQLDRIVSDFVKLYLKKDAVYKTKFKPFKKGKEKLCCELVIPFSFSIVRFYREPANYYYHNPFFMQNQMMHQQMMQQHMMQSIPKSPVGF